MAQKSYPWGRSLGVDSMVGYTSKQWYSVWGAIAKSGAVVIDGGITTDPTTYNIGVFYSIGNKLEVTTPGNARIDVATGAALVEGAFFENDATIGAGGDVNVGPANLLVVVRKNYSAIAYVPAVASAALFTVPAYTARVTVIDSATFTQDVARLTYWDIPLALFDINAGGVISNWVDLREYADAETKSLFVTPMMVFDDTGIAECAVVEYGYVMPDAAVCRMYGTVVIPSDFIAGTNLTIQVHFPVKPAAAGDINISGDLKWALCGEWYDIHSGSVNGPVTVTSDPVHYLINCLLTKTIAPSPLDQLFLYYTRDATAGADTINDSVYVRGWLLSYLGWR